MQDPPSATLRMPAHNLSPEYLQWRATRNMRSHFWAPNNEANRHLAQMTEQERMTLRDIPRRRVGPPGVGGAAPYAQTTVDSSGMIAEKMGEVTKPHALTGNQLLRVKQQPSRLEWKEDCAETSESREHNAEHSPPQALKVATRMFKDPQELGAWYNELSSDEEKPRERDDSSAPETSRRRAVAEGGEGQSDDSAYTSSDSDGEVGRPVRAASPQGVKRTGARVNDERRGKTKDGRGAGEAKKKEGKTMGTVGRKDRVFVDVISGKPVEEAPEVLQGGRIEKWRVSMVHTHKKGEPRHSGAWDKVPAHQSYGFYKYYGFAGRGAATSWAHNPKYGPAEGQYYGPRSGSAPSQSVHLTQSTSHLAVAKEDIRRKDRRARSMTVDLVTGKEVETSDQAKGKKKKDGYGTAAKRTDDDLEPWRKAQVITHKAPARYQGRRPYHANYSHYKYYGFAGQGAKTAHALNPKLTHLKLLEADQEERPRKHLPKG